MSNWRRHGAPQVPCHHRRARIWWNYEATPRCAAVPRLRGQKLEAGALPEVQAIDSNPYGTPLWPTSFYRPSGATPLGRITRSQVLRWFDGYSQTAPGGANRTLQLLRQILNFAIACGHGSANPARAIKRTGVRTHAFSLAAKRFGACIARSTHTWVTVRVRASRPKSSDCCCSPACRKNEILSLRWSEVHGDTLALGDSKTGPRTVPLNAQARRLIERQPPRSRRVRVPFPTRRPTSPKSRAPLVVLGAKRSRHRRCSPS